MNACLTFKSVLHPLLKATKHREINVREAADNIEKK